MRTDNPESDAENEAFDELYRIECEDANKRIEEAKNSTFERFRDRFINGMDKFLTKIN